MPPTLHPEVWELIKDVNRHMGAQTEATTRIDGWMAHLDEKIDAMPRDCPTGRESLRRLDKIEEEHKYPPPRATVGRGTRKEKITIAIPMVGGGAGILGFIIAVVVGVLKMLEVAD